MRLLKVIQRRAVILLLAYAAFAAETTPDSGPILPKQFGGWQLSDTVQTSKDSLTADPTNAALLKEYGFTDFESGSYTRDDGRKLAVKAARFVDASGAYGAYTYYKMPQMLKEKIGDGAASLNERILFYRGNIVIDAVFSKLTVMSAAELRDLADALPMPRGSNRNLPGLPTYLPQRSYVANTAKYIVGPIALDRVGSPLTADLVDFSAGAEVVLGTYTTSAGEATLTLISYPTPQIAVAHIGKIDAARTAAEQQHTPNLLPQYDRRTGPIVAVVTGSISENEAKSLLASVNYEADVTWNENTYFDKKNNIGTLVWNALILSGILMLFALALGLAFGGARIVIARLFPHKIFNRPEDVEFISLNLEETAREAVDSEVSSSIKAV